MTTADDTTEPDITPVVDLDLDAELEAEEGLEPFTFTLGGQPWTVPPPDVATTLDAEQAPFLSDFFRIVMGKELWREFEPTFRAVKKPSATWRLGRGISRAFRMDPVSVQDAVEDDDRAQMSNRAGRRAAGQRGGRRGGPRRR